MWNCLINITNEGSKIPTEVIFLRILSSLWEFLAENYYFVCSIGGGGGGDGRGWGSHISLILSPKYLDIPFPINFSTENL